MSTPILEARGLAKGYKEKSLVLENFNLEIPSGCIFGLLGPNGCGKSTFIKLTAGLLVPTAGEILIDGKPRTEESNALISYLPERPCYDPGQSVTGLLDYYCDFFADFDRAAAERMLDDLSIPKGAILKTLSKGTKEKVQLILTMARRAKLYLLDEPIGGVDPAARDYILSTIIGNYSSDASVLITTHLIYDVEPVLDRFAFLDKGGKIRLSGQVDEAREQYGKSLNDIFREVFSCSENF